MKDKRRSSPLNNFSQVRFSLRYALVVSFAVNIGLGGLAWLLWRRGSNVTHPISQTVHSTKAALDPKLPESHVTPAAASPAENASFSWHQLDTTDFPTFVARLRGIECPESTIRDIIKGELDEIYADKRRQLLGPRGVVDRASLSPALKQQLDRLVAEEDEVLAQLLNPPSSTAVAAARAPDNANATPKEKFLETLRRYAQRETPLRQPLVFQEVNTSGMNLNPAQKEAIELMRQDFLTAIGGSNQNPSDPRYMEKWRKAQRDSDAALRLQLGSSLYDQYEAAAQ